MTTRHEDAEAPAIEAGAARRALLNNPYGLTLREVRAEIRRCLTHGWQLWEIRLRFADDSKDHRP